MAREPWDRRLMDGLAKESWAAANDPGRLQQIGFRVLMRSRYGKLSLVLGPSVYIAIFILFGFPWAFVSMFASVPVRGLLERKAKVDLLEKGLVEPPPAAAE